MIWWTEDSGMPVDWFGSESSESSSFHSNGTTSAKTLMTATASGGVSATNGTTENVTASVTDTASAEESHGEDGAITSAVAGGTTYGKQMGTTAGSSHGPGTLNVTASGTYSNLVSVRTSSSAGTTVIVDGALRHSTISAEGGGTTEAGTSTATSHESYSSSYSNSFDESFELQLTTTQSATETVEVAMTTTRSMHWDMAGSVFTSTEVWATTTTSTLTSEQTVLTTASTNESLENLQRLMVQAGPCEVLHKAPGGTTSSEDVWAAIYSSTGVTLSLTFSTVSAGDETTLNTTESSSGSTHSTGSSTAGSSTTVETIDQTVESASNTESRNATSQAVVVVPPWAADLPNATPCGVRRSQLGAGYQHWQSCATSDDVWASYSISGAVGTQTAGRLGEMDGRTVVTPWDTLHHTLIMGGGLVTAEEVNGAGWGFPGGYVTVTAEHGAINLTLCDSTGGTTTLTTTVTASSSSWEFGPGYQVTVAGCKTVSFGDTISFDFSTAQIIAVPCQQTTDMPLP